MHRHGLRFCLLLFIFHTTNVIQAQERAIDHAPIGVMGDHFHGQGEWMISARYMRMAMGNNRTGTTDLSDMDIIKQPNPYRMGTMSTTLSVVPQNMTMGMAMLGVMYAPIDTITLMGMGMLTDKNMTLNTYRGTMGMGNMGGMAGGMHRANLGSFSTSTFDLSELSLSGLVKLYEGNVSRVHAQIGIQQSVGANDALGEVLTPMNMRKTMILPYGMQSGDGSTSVISALTYVATVGGRAYGGQMSSQNAFATDLWSFGDSLTLTGWIQQELVEKTSLSFRATYHKQDSIAGRNPAIMAPVQTANPDNYGGTVTEIGVGLNQIISVFSGHHADRIGIELTYPIVQDLNGPQMKSGLKFQVGYQKSFGF